MNKHIFFCMIITMVSSLLDGSVHHALSCIVTGTTIKPQARPKYWLFTGRSVKIMPLSQAELAIPYEASIGVVYTSMIHANVPNEEILLLDPTIKSIRNLVPNFFLRKHTSDL